MPNSIRRIVLSNHLQHKDNDMQATSRETKTHAHCKTPGCLNVATFFPHAFAPNCGFCDKHGAQIIVATVKSINNGTHPSLLAK